MNENYYYKNKSKEEYFDYMIGILKETIYFGRLKESEIKKICKVMTIEDYKKNSIIFKENEKGDSFYIIAEGSVEISITTDGNKRILSIMGKYDGFGELAIIDKKQRSATAKCLEDTTVLKINESDFENIVKITEGFSISLSYVLSKIVRNSNQLIILDLKERNKLLQDSVTQLQELQEVIVSNERLVAVGKFASRMIHDLKNILNNVSNTIQIMKIKTSKNKNIDISDLDKYFDIMTNSITEMNALCVETLEFSQGNTQLNRKKVNTYEYLNSFVKKMPEICENKKIKLVVDINTKGNIEIDESKFDRVLTNIFNNSIEALENIQNPEIKLKAIENNTNNVDIIIEDNGKGICNSYKDKVFEQFFTNGKVYGTGLGLTISKEIINLLNGNIKLDSKENKGTIVTISLNTI